MRRLFVVLPLLMVPMWIAHSQNPALGKTGDFVNGRYWKSLPDLAKAAYLYGLIEVVTQVPDEAGPKCGCVLDVTMSLYKSFSADNATYSEFVQEMDAFYREPANLRIPVLAAVRYSVMKMKGSSKAQLEACEADLRKGAVEPLPRTKCSSQ